ncbi:MAG TPA: glycosyltransferase family 2 protein [Pirellulales bacterium]|jgi:undecaprenyl-phosphate 4-deoxy-4-formamido-L-arabinose transferase|nr:glycosyltransferase family 2 protein [Pirellulales bacterium]
MSRLDTITEASTGSPSSAPAVGFRTQQATSLPGGISVVVPVYNGEGTLAELVERLSTVLPNCATAYEVILVNDGSRDRSWKRVCELAELHSWVRGINLMRNYGQHNALLCGIRSASFDTTVTLDDDLQNPPEEIPKLVARLAEGHDVVYGKPLREQHGLLRDVASLVTKLALQTAIGAETARDVSAFRALRTNARGGFEHFHGPFVSVDVLLTWGTKRFSAIPVRHERRASGLSNYTFRMLVAHAMNMMTGFSTLPLRIGSFLGFSFTFLGIIVLIYVVGRYLIQGSSVAGFPFLAAIIAIFSGVQLFTLGIIGEYLARMHFRLMDRPAYAVRETVGCGPNSNQLP